MGAIPSGTERIRPFVPAKDFDLSKRCYEAIGFEKVLDGEVAIFNAASGGFILQHDPCGVLWHVVQRREETIAQPST